MSSQYSLRDVVTDGALTAPRWLQHLVKLATHASLAFALWAITGKPFGSAMFAGPLLWLVLVAHEAIWPTDPEPLTAWQHIADWMTDLALATLPVVGAFAALGDYLGAALLLGACVAGYLAGHRDARP